MTNYLDDAYEAANESAIAARNLSMLAEDLYVVGLDRAADRASMLAKQVGDNSKTILSALGRDSVERSRASDQETKRMMAVALGVADFNG